MMLKLTRDGLVRNQTGVKGRSAAEGSTLGQCLRLSYYNFRIEAPVETAGISADTQGGEVLTGHHHPAAGAVNQFNDAIRRRDDDEFHLHRFQHDHWISGADTLSRLNGD